MLFDVSQSSICRNEIMLPRNCCSQYVSKIYTEFRVCDYIFAAVVCSNYVFFVCLPAGTHGGNDPRCFLFSVVHSENFLLRQSFVAKCLENVAS